MSRQRLPIGTLGGITLMNLPDGRVEVRTRYRDFDGKARLVSARAATKSAALAELKKRLAQRSAYQPVDTALTLDSLFGELVDYWLADLDLEGRLASSTRRGYEEASKLVLPAFQPLTLREIGVARCDGLLKTLGPPVVWRSKRAKTVLRLAFGLAVRHEVVPRNPIDGVAKLHKPKRTPAALTATEVNAIRAVIKAWEHTRGTSGPNPDGQLGQIEVMLGTSCPDRRGAGHPPLRPRRHHHSGHSADLRHRRLPARRRHIPPAPPQDRPLEQGRGAADVHSRGSAAPPGGHGRPVAGGVGVPEQGGHAAADGKCAAPASQGPR